MPKRILLIDSDEPFAQGLAAAAIQAGFKAWMVSDSEKGMALAKQENPDLIVVCVEAQPTNGYMLCTRLKKDERLKAIPVILTSANATPDSFEKHKKLKTRAEDYLIKPFPPQAMLQKAWRLLGVSESDGAGGAVAGDESLGLGDLIEGEDEPIQLGEAEAAQAHAVGEEALDVEELEELLDIDEDSPASPGQSAGDDDLEMFDQAFDALTPAGAGAAPPRKPSPTRSNAGARSPHPGRAPAELSAPTDGEMLRLTDDAELAIEPQPRVPQPARATDELSRLKEELAKRDAAAKALQQRADALAAAAKKFERELTVAREERDELRRLVVEAQSAAKQNEQRAVKAYQKMKGDEKLREKTRKALQIALALLDDVTIQSDSESDEESA
jgi:DNA-binding response OmpR family regulator